MGRLASGDLVEKLYLQAPPVPVPNGIGGFAKGAATPPVLCYASAKVISGTEAVRLGQTLGAEVVVFTIRYRASVTTSTLATWQGKSFGIRHVRKDAKFEWMELTCVNGDNA